MPPVPPNHMQQQFNSPFGNPVPVDNRIIQQAVPAMQQTPPQLPQHSVMHVETSESSQKLEQAGSEMRSNELQGINQKFEQQQQQQSSQVSCKSVVLVDISVNSCYFQDPIDLKMLDKFGRDETLGRQREMIHLNVFET